MVGFLGGYNKTQSEHCVMAIENISESKDRGNYFYS